MPYATGLSTETRSDAPLRVPPRSEEAELAVLGCMLIEKEALLRAVELLKEEDFYVDKNRILFRVFREFALKDKTLDILTAAEELKRKELYAEVGSAEVLMSAVESAVTAAHIDDYIAIVREKRVLRGLVEAGQHILDDAYGENPAGEVLERAQRQIYLLGDTQSQGRGIKGMSDIVHEYGEELEELSRHKKAVTGLSTGFTRLDEMTTGLQPGNLIIIAARPGVGKTSFALNIAENVAVKQKLPVIFFSLEMSQKEIIGRLISSMSGIDLGKLRTGYWSSGDWVTIAQKLEELADSPFYMDNSYSALTPLSLRSSIRRFASKQKPALVIIDYLQLMHGVRRESRQVEVSDISRSLKELALELNIPIIALSQLNRGTEEHSREGKPRLSDLRESGSIEQDSDLVAFIYREALYKKSVEEDNLRKAQIIIAKHRNGCMGEVDVTFLREYTKFVNAEN